MCLYVFIRAMCEKHEFMMMGPWYMYKMLLGTWLYVWYVIWSHMILLHDYEVQKYDYEKWWNAMYMKNDENA